VLPLPDANRPEWLPGGDKKGQPDGTNMCFGTLRYGKLFEAVLYDCRRYIDSKGAHAQVVPQWVEDWLIGRTHAEDTTHFMHVPSLPFAYSSGELGDWYPDLLDEASGRLVLYKPKEGWQPGWFAQHQRLIEAIGSQNKRAPIIVQGDFPRLGSGLDPALRRTHAEKQGARRADWHTRNGRPPVPRLPFAMSNPSRRSWKAWTKS
jgi:hypothetical protein